MNPAQFAELKETLQDTHNKVSQIHTTVFGAEGQGGVLRDVAELKKHREEMTVFKAKLLGMVLAASAFASFIGSKLSTLIFGSGGKTP